MLGALIFLCLMAGTAFAAPVVRNGSFEEDRYTTAPGLARDNGGIITGWNYTGNAGINPVWKAPSTQQRGESPFYDNGAIPHGKQLALIQGPGSLSQVISGFEAGKRYALEFYENGRVQHQGTQWPRVKVTLGGEEIVSPHEVSPVTERDNYEVPFYRVVSAPFTAPGNGGFELVIATVQESRTTTLLLDAVRIIELPAEDIKR